MTFGDYVAFVDESGDHSLTSINTEYPVFVLAFCVFEKERYAARVLPAATRLKYKYFGHDAVVLNDRELELAFRRVCQGSNAKGSTLALDQVMMDKKANSAGVQFSDLVARPIGRHVLQPAKRIGRETSCRVSSERDRVAAWRVRASRSSRDG